MDKKNLKLHSKLTTPTLNASALSKTSVEAKGAVPKKIKRKITSTPVRDTECNLTFHSNISAIKNKTEEMKNIPQCELDYLYSEYLISVYKTANLRKKFENEKKPVDVKLRRMQNEVIKKEETLFKEKEKVLQLNNLSKVQSLFKGVDFSHEFEKVMSGARGLEIDLGNNSIPDDVESHINKLKLNKIDLLKNGSIERTKDDEVDSMLPEEDYETKMKIQKLMDDNHLKNVVCQEKLQTLEKLNCLKKSLDFTLMEKEYFKE